MELQNHRGCLNQWNDTKGFGFIKPVDGKDKIFIHISALKRMSRRPTVGDIIHYEIHTDNNGKNRAVNARIEGVSSIKFKKQKKIVNKRQNYYWIYQLFIIIALSIYALIQYENNFQYSDLQSNTKLSTVYSKAVIPTPARKKYSCNGKIYCSEMNSCAEAKFYLRNCPNTKMDGDGDGVPCESQWCSW